MPLRPASPPTHPPFPTRTFRRALLLLQSDPGYSGREFYYEEDEGALNPEGLNPEGLNPGEVMVPPRPWPLPGGGFHQAVVADWSGRGQAALERLAAATAGEEGEEVAGAGAEVVVVAEAGAVAAVAAARRLASVSDPSGVVLEVVVVLPTKILQSRVDALVNRIGDSPQVTMADGWRVPAAVQRSTCAWRWAQCSRAQPAGGGNTCAAAHHMLGMHAPRCLPRCIVHPRATTAHPPPCSVQAEVTNQWQHYVI